MTGFTFPRSYGGNASSFGVTGDRNNRQLETFLDSGVVLQGEDGEHLVVPSAMRAATVEPTAYPIGRSVIHVSGDSSWPGSTGLAEAYIANVGGASRIRQVFTDKPGYLMYHRFSDDGVTWNSWQLVTPYEADSGTSTAYNVVDFNTWETAHTLTVTALPSVRFEARASATVTCRATSNSASQLTHQLRVRISLDGGSTWTLQFPNTGSQYEKANAFVALAAQGRADGAVTGNIVFELQVWSNTSSTDFDDLSIAGRVLGRH